MRKLTAKEQAMKEQAVRVLIGNPLATNAEILAQVGSPIPEGIFADARVEIGVVIYGGARSRQGTLYLDPYTEACKKLGEAPAPLDQNPQIHIVEGLTPVLQPLNPNDREEHRRIIGCGVKKHFWLKPSDFLLKNGSIHQIDGWEGAGSRDTNSGWVCDLERQPLTRVLAAAEVALHTGEFAAEDWYPGCGAPAMIEDGGHRREALLRRLQHQGDDTPILVWCHIRDNRDNAQLGSVPEQIIATNNRRGQTTGHTIAAVLPGSAWYRELTMKRKMEFKTEDTKGTLAWKNIAAAHLLYKGGKLEGGDPRGELMIRCIREERDTKAINEVGDVLVELLKLIQGKLDDAPLRAFLKPRNIAFVLHLWHDNDHGVVTNALAGFRKAHNAVVASGTEKTLTLGEKNHRARYQWILSILNSQPGMGVKNRLKLACLDEAPKQKKERKPRQPRAPRAQA